MPDDTPTLAKVRANLDAAELAYAQNRTTLYGRCLRQAYVQLCLLIAAADKAAAAERLPPKERR